MSAAELCGPGYLRSSWSPSFRGTRAVPAVRGLWFPSRQPRDAAGSERRAAAAPEEPLSPQVGGRGGGGGWCPAVDVRRGSAQPGRRCRLPPSLPAYRWVRLRRFRALSLSEGKRRLDFQEWRRLSWSEEQG